MFGEQVEGIYFLVDEETVGGGEYLKTKKCRDRAELFDAKLSTHVLDDGGDKVRFTSSDEHVIDIDKKVYLSLTCVINKEGGISGVAFEPLGLKMI